MSLCELKQIKMYTTKTSFIVLYTSSTVQVKYSFSLENEIKIFYCIFDLLFIGIMVCFLVTHKYLYIVLLIWLVVFINETR